MSQFKNKIQNIRLGKICQNQPCRDSDNNCTRNVCSAEIKLRGHCSNSPREHILNQHPIYIVNKRQKQPKQKKQPKQQKQLKQTTKKPIKKVQPFIPIQIPSSPRNKIDSKLKSLYQNYNYNSNTQSSTPCTKKQIQIHIDSQKDNKQCLKKLFKKIHKLTEDLAQSQKQRIRLQLQLNNLRDVDGNNRGQEKDLMKLEGQNYKLRSDIDYFKELLKQRNNQIQALKNKIPSQIIKQIVVEKPVQVRVEVPKYVPGPQKIVEIPKYIENKANDLDLQNYKKKINDLQNQLFSQKKKYLEIANKPQKQRQQQNQIAAIVQKPVYLEKPIYVDRPIYIQKPIERQKVVEVPIQIPYQVPIYVQKPVMDNDLYLKLSEMQRDLQIFANENQQLRRQNFQLRTVVNHLQTSLEIVRRHNCQKNHQIEILLQNQEDYNPIKVRQMIRTEARSQGRNLNYRNAQNLTTFNANLNRNL